MNLPIAKMPIAAKKDIAKSVKTLLVMLQSMRDQRVRITLRNDTLVTGTIIKVDADMKIELRDAMVQLDKFYCTDKDTLNLLDVRQHLCKSKQAADPRQTSEDFHGDNHHRSDISDMGTQQSADGNINNDSHSQGVIEAGTRATNSGDSYALGQHNRSAIGMEIDDDNDKHVEDDQDHESTATLHEYFVVMGSRVRHIDLPTDCDPLSATKREIQRIRDRTRQWTKKDIVH